MLRATIWLSVFAWSASELARAGGRARLARVLYTTGALLLAAHTAAAFSQVHGWSHAAAVASTSQQTEAMTGLRSGSGLYLNYLFLLVWLADAAMWWIAPRAHAARSRGAELALFALFVFMMVNGAVVFATSAMWMGGACAVIVAMASRAGLLGRHAAGRVVYD